MKIETEAKFNAANTFLNVSCKILSKSRLQGPIFNTSMQPNASNQKYLHFAEHYYYHEEEIERIESMTSL